MLAPGPNLSNLTVTRLDKMEITTVPKPLSVSARLLRNRVTPTVWLAAMALMVVMLPPMALAVEAASQSEAPLGTLFYTAAERNAIVRARQGQGNIGATPEATAATVPINPFMTINGVVKRKSGNSTVWINGQAVQEGQSMTPVTRLTPTDRGVTLDGKPVSVGETLDLTTHERSDIVAPGAVTIKMPK